MTYGSKIQSLFVIATVLLASTVHAQYGRFEFSAEDIPTYYSRFWREYDCVNTYSEHSSSDTILYDMSGDLRLSKIWIDGDTVTFEGYDDIADERATLSIVLDKTNKIIRYFFYACGSFSQEIARYLTLIDIPYLETTTHLKVELSKNTLPGHHFSMIARDHESNGALYETKHYKNLDDFDLQSSLTLELDKQYFATVREENTATLSLYPIPATEFLYISGIQDQTDIEIFNSLGRKILSVPCSPEKSILRIDIHSLAAGQYWLRLGNEYRKFVTFRSL